MFLHGVEVRSWKWAAKWKLHKSWSWSTLPRRLQLVSTWVVYDWWLGEFYSYIQNGDLSKLFKMSDDTHEVLKYFAIFCKSYTLQFWAINLSWPVISEYIERLFISRSLLVYWFIYLLSVIDFLREMNRINLRLCTERHSVKFPDPSIVKAATWMQSLYGKLALVAVGPVTVVVFRSRRNK